MKLEATTNIRSGGGGICRRGISAFLSELLNELSLPFLQLRGRVACQGKISHNLPILHGKIIFLLVAIIFTYIVH
jgi:hypothetical protein